MAHAVAPLPPAAAGEDGPLSLEITTRTAWNILMMREDRWGRRRR